MVVISSPYVLIRELLREQFLLRLNSMLKELFEYLVLAVVLASEVLESLLLTLPQEQGTVARLFE
jgi:hypothetical protein